MPLGDLPPQHVPLCAECERAYKPHYNTEPDTPEFPQTYVPYEEGRTERYPVASTAPEHLHYTDKHGKQHGLTHGVCSQECWEKAKARYQAAARERRERGLRAGETGVAYSLHRYHDARKPRGPKPVVANPAEGYTPQRKPSVRKHVIRKPTP